MDINHCQEKVFDGWHDFQCKRKIWNDGYCKQHHPDTVKARREGEKSASRFNSGRILGGTDDEC
jgi:hypothetical protein